MSRSIIVAAALAVLTAGTASVTQAATPHGVTKHVTTRPPGDADGSTIHDWNGQRYDVPNDMLRSPGVLINGLSPQPVQFE